MKWGQARVIGVVLLALLIIVISISFYYKGSLIKYSSPVVGSTGSGGVEATYPSCSDGIDNDNDGLIDCEDDGCNMVSKSNRALLCNPSYGCEDKDGDGFYVQLDSNEIETSGTSVYCGAYLDCNDDDKTISPSTDNAEKDDALCNDGIDNDCSGSKDICKDFDTSNKPLSDANCLDLYYEKDQTCCFINGAGSLVALDENNCGACGKKCCSSTTSGSYSNLIGPKDTCVHNGGNTVHNPVCKGEYTSGVYPVAFTFPNGVGDISSFNAKDFYFYSLYSSCGAGSGACSNKNEQGGFSFYCKREY
jgi:hypothetical protein